MDNIFILISDGQIKVSFERGHSIERVEYMCFGQMRENCRSLSKYEFHETMMDSLGRADHHKLIFTNQHIYVYGL